MVIRYDGFLRLESVSGCRLRALPETLALSRLDLVAGGRWLIKILGYNKIVKGRWRQGLFMEKIGSA
ncbi:MAG: hypothetical protein LBH85_06550 [Treponema sp.]|nr:hypothetical protein [Treponema sp.]